MDDGPFSQFNIPKMCDILNLNGLKMREEKRLLLGSLFCIFYVSPTLQYSSFSP